jgi:hypothetical protein
VRKQDRGKRDKTAPRHFKNSTGDLDFDLRQRNFPATPPALFQPQQISAARPQKNLPFCVRD